MTLQELAEKKTSEYMHGCPKNLMGFIVAKNMFIKGFKEAITWHDVDIAPKDGTKICVVHSGALIDTVAFWSGNDFRDAFNGTIIYPSKWTHLPSYKKENQ